MVGSRSGQMLKCACYLSNRYTLSSSWYRKRQSMWLKRQYPDVYNRLCSMLSCFFSLTCNLTENTVSMVGSRSGKMLTCACYLSNRCTSSSSGYRKRQSMWLKRQYPDVYNRLCSMLSCFFNLTSNLTENTVSMVGSCSGKMLTCACYLNNRYTSSSSGYRKRQSMWLKRQYPDVYNRLCSMLSCFFSLTSNLAENTVSMVGSRSGQMVKSA